MNDLSVTGTLDLFMVAMLAWVGGLAVYSAIRLQRDYILFDSKILYATDCDPRACQDDAGFIAYMVPRLWIFAVWLLIPAVLITLNSILHLIALPDWLRYYALPALGFAAFVWYIFVMRTASKRFWKNPQTQRKGKGK